MHAGQSGCRRHFCRSCLHLRASLGSKVLVDGDIHGTVLGKSVSSEQMTAALYSHLPLHAACGEAGGYQPPVSTRAQISPPTLLLARNSFVRRWHRASCRLSSLCTFRVSTPLSKTWSWMSCSKIHTEFLHCCTARFLCCRELSFSLFNGGRAIYIKDNINSLVWSPSWRISVKASFATCPKVLLLLFNFWTKPIPSMIVTHGVGISSAAGTSFSSSVARATLFVIFHVRRRRHEMYSGPARLCVCLSVCPSLHSHTTTRTRM